MSDHKPRNTRVAELLQEKGDSLEVPREVQHWAYFPTAESRAKFVSLLGIRFESIESYECPAPSSNMQAVTFVHVGLPDEESMTQITDMLNRFALDCGGEYDGWETQVLT